MVVQFGPLKLDLHIETAAYILQSIVAKQSRRADLAVVGFPKQTPTSGLFWNAPVQPEEAKGAPQCKTITVIKDFEWILPIFQKDVIRIFCKIRGE